MSCWTLHRSSRIAGSAAAGRDAVLAAARGRVLGLVGPGADSAARALIHHARSESGSGPDWRVLVVDEDLAALCPGSKLDLRTGELAPAPTTGHALAELESGLKGDYLVVCRSSPEVDRRLPLIQRKNKAVGAVVLGRSPHGDSICVDQDGLVVGASTRRARRLIGYRLFHALESECRDLQVACDLAVQKPAALDVLGPVTLHVRVRGEWRDVTRRLAPKQRELLAFLAVAGPDGARRDDVARSLWPARPAARPYNSLHNAMSLLRRAVAEAAVDMRGDVVERVGRTYRINPALVSVDYWDIQDSDGLAAVERYRGELASEVWSLWIDIPRQAVRRDVSEVARRMVRSTDLTAVAAALEILEKIRSVDPYNEEICHDIVGAHARLGNMWSARQAQSTLDRVLRETGNSEPCEPLGRNVTSQ